MNDLSEYGRSGRGQDWRKLPSNPDELLSHYRQWLLKVAWEMTRSKPHLKDDLAQEGHIAMWRALKTYDPDKGSISHWLTKCARWRMGECLRRNELWTGTDNQRGHERFAPPEPIDPQDEFYASAIVDGSEAIDKVIMGYHYGDILKALNELTAEQREYVLLRFWGEKTYTELFLHFKKNPSDLWKVAKPKLARELAHLASV
jgi:RNA polymerase sigma factor (sigma-70 family)